MRNIGLYLIQTFLCISQSVIFSTLRQQCKPRRKIFLSIKRQDPDMKKAIITAVLFAAASATVAQSEKILPYGTVNHNGTVHFSTLSEHKNQPEISWFSYECAASRLYTDFSTDINTRTRRYPNGSGSYAEASAAPVQQMKKFIPENHVQTACRNVPDYRLVLSENGKDTVLDLNSISNNTATVFYVYPEITQESSYDNPYDIKAEIIQTDCAAQNNTSLLLSGLDLYQGRVTDAVWMVQAKEPIAAKLKKVVCQPETAAKLPPYFFSSTPKPRAKFPF